MSRSANERILVVARGHVGDVLQALPALRDIRRAKPDAHVTVLLNEYVSAALDGCPYVDHVLIGFTYRKRGAVADAAHTARVLCAVARRFDTVIGLRWSPTLTPVMAVLSGASIRVGYDRTGTLGRLLTHDLGAEPIDTVSNRVLNQAPLRALHIESDPSYPRIDWMPESIRQEAAALLESVGISSIDRFAVLQLSSHWGCSEWGSDKWAALGEHMSAAHGLKLLVTGTGERFERDKLDSVRRRSRAAFSSLLGRTSLPHLFEVVRRADLVVAGDSALAQVALAQRTPSVVMFGIEEIEANGPLPGEESTLMLTIQHWDRSAAPVPNPHCAFGNSHCHSRFCTEDYSRRAITAGQVIEKVDLAVLTTTITA